MVIPGRAAGAKSCQFGKVLFGIWPRRVRHSQSPLVNWLNFDTGVPHLPVHDGPKTQNASVDPRRRRNLAPDEIERVAHTGYQGSADMLGAMH